MTKPQRDFMAPKTTGKKGPPVPWEEFLISVSPGSHAAVEGILEKSTSDTWCLAAPDLLLHCSSPRCDGLRIFGGKADSKYLDLSKWNHRFLIYRCKNCERIEKFFSVLFRRKAKNSPDGEAIKVGEWPPFGPQVPTEVMALIGPDHETFVKGRRAENQGLGLGAFTYYCRVLENQRMRLLDHIIESAKTVGATDTTLEIMERAREEAGFSKMVRALGDAVPPSLNIRGLNPLMLLDHALAEGTARKPDRELLQIAKSIRVVLTEMAERIDQTLQDRAELNQAIEVLTADLDDEEDTET